MMRTTSLRNRTILAALAVVIGLTMTYGIPILVQTALERVLFHLSAHIAEGYPEFSSGLKLFDFFFSVYRALIFSAGAALIVISPAIRQGRDWTFPLALTLFAIPAIAGAFMFLPYVSWVPGFPLPMVISFIGLIGYWALILLRDGEDRTTRWLQFAALTFIGMMITHAFTIGVGAQRTMATRPDWPFYPNFRWWMFRWAGEVNWVSALVLFISIPFLAMKKEAGWWMAVIASITILMINIPTQFVRTRTLDYLNGALLAIGILVFLMPPAFKARLLGTARAPEE